MLKTAFHCSNDKIPADNWKKTGEIFYSFAAKELQKMMPPLMSGSIVSRSLDSVQQWYDSQIRDVILKEMNKVVNYALDDATLRSMFSHFFPNNVTFISFLCCVLQLPLKVR